MVSTDYEIEGADKAGDFAYKVHSVLEGRGENESEFEELENLTQEVADFYNQFSNYAGGTGTSTRFIELNFEVYLEDGEYGPEQRVEAVDRLIQEPSEPSLPEF